LDEIKGKIFFMFLIMALPFIVPTTVSAEEGVANVATDAEFKAAIADNTKKVINLTADIDLSNAGVLNVEGRDIDLKGFTISSTNFSLIFEGSNFTIKNGNLDSKNGSYALFIGDSSTTDNVLIENVNAKGGVNVYNSTNVGKSTFTVESGNYTSNGVAAVITFIILLIKKRKDNK